MGPLGHSAAAAAALVGLPLGLVGFALRPALRLGWRERLGQTPEVEPGAVWVHGASVGEVQAAFGLFDALADSGQPLVASAMTTTGRTLLRQCRPEVPSTLAPLDHPWCAAAALRRTRPAALVFVETELWPSWLMAARDAGIPVLFVSARLSDRSFPRYRRAARLLGPALRAVSAVGARSPEDAERFRLLGIPSERVEVTGNLKLEPGPVRTPLAPDLQGVLGDVPLVVAGSTHAGEEEAALAALRAAEQADLEAALLLAPRHPERFDAAERTARASGRPVRRRSALGPTPLAAGEVLLLDSLGELPSVWQRADVAFVGGSLVPRGGHNVAEPARASRAVLFGPHIGNAREPATLLLAADAAVQVADATQLAVAVVTALRDPEGWSTRGKRAAAALERHAGATERSVALIRHVAVGKRD
jgi:3-deoxy-D-manno-octulosonic-acid transferase